MFDINQIANQYDKLIPSKEDTLIILFIKERIRNNEISEKFTKTNFSDSITEIHERGLFKTIPQTEAALQRLNLFINTLRSENYKLQLSNYAEKFIQLIENKLDSRYKNFPLKATFEKLFKLDSSEIKNINDLNFWFQAKFNDTSKESINTHIEALQDEVNQILDNLKDILKVLQQISENSFLAKIQEFTDQFGLLGEKAEQTAEALKLKNNIQIALEGVVLFFQQKVQYFNNADAKQQQDELNSLRQDWQKAKDIQNEIYTFFENVDLKMQNIQARITYASNRLTELHENFKSHSYIKNNLKNMLIFALRYSKIVGEKFILPDEIPLKPIPYQEQKFRFVLHYNWAKPITNTQPKKEQDKEYEEAERRKAKKQNDVRERTAFWLKKLKQELNEKHFLYLNDCFAEIESESIDVAMSVSYELVNFVSNNKKYQIEIKNELEASSRPENTLLWKTKIKSVVLTS